MYLFIKACAIMSPIHEDRFLIGVHAVLIRAKYLENGRAIYPRVMFISDKLNPWGFKGETAEVIKEFLEETDVCDLYPYPGGFNIYPVVKPVDLLPLFRRDEEIRYNPIRVWEVAKDFGRSINHKLVIDSTELFSDIYGSERSWKFWNEGANEIPLNGIVSESYLFSGSEREIISRPYYVIQRLSGYYYKTHNEVSYSYENSMQFDSEQDALDVACESYSKLQDGFQILESRPATLEENLRIC